MEMPTDIMCTATCVTWAGEHVVIAKMDNVGPSILVWDLFANEAAREIRYHHPAGEALRLCEPLSRFLPLLLIPCLSSSQECHQTPALLS